MAKVEDGVITRKPKKSSVSCGKQDISDNVPLSVTQRRIFVCHLGREFHNRKQNEIIHAYLNLLVFEHPGKVFVFPSFLSLKWQRGAYSDWFYEKVDLTTFRWLLVPVHHNNHWFLLAVDNCNSTVMVLNSLDNPKEDEMFFLHWCKYITQRNKVVPSKVSAITRAHSHCGKQLDSHRCGVFV